jgi:hypothetical protein
VEVRQEDVPDLDPVPLRRLEVALDVALRVDDDGRLRRLVGQEVRRVREAGEGVVLEDQGWFSKIAAGDAS